MYKKGDIIRQTDYNDNKILSHSYIRLISPLTRIESKSKCHWEVEVLLVHVYKGNGVVEKSGSVMEWWLPDKSQESFRDMSRKWEVISEKELIIDAL